MAYNPEFDSELECSYLMLASIHVDRKRYDLAKDILCKHCFVEQKKSNCSYLTPCSSLGSSKAYEIMGLICEREKMFKDAIFYYGKSWEMEKDLLSHDDNNNVSPAIIVIGFKLASCYMASNNIIEAMEISDFISNKFPEHSQFKEEIVNRCTVSIRP